MSQKSQRNNPMRLAVAVGVVALGVVYLPAALAGPPKTAKTCEAGETRMCDPQGNTICAKDSEVAEKEGKGYTLPVNGSCPKDPVSPN